LGKLAQIDEGSMKKATKNPTGPKFGGYWKGTQKSPPKPGQGAGGGCEESIIKDLEKAITENPRTRSHNLMREYKEFLNEYGGVGGYGAASQAPQGDTNQQPDPEAQQLKLDQDQIKKNVNQVATPLDQQGAAQSLNKVKFGDVMNKLDDKSNTQLNAQELQQMEPMAVATSKALQNPQTANQMKQLINKADMLDQQKQQKVQQQKQQVGTNTPAADQQAQQQPGQQNQPQQSQQPGQVK
jgi:chemotaxis protein histidine kinase CheA